MVTLIPHRNLFVPVLTGGLDKTPISCDLFFLTNNPFFVYLTHSKASFYQKFLSEKLFIVHVNDVERASRRQMRCGFSQGKGIIPLRSILRALKAIGYTRGFSVEIFRAQNWNRPPLQVAREARKSAVAASGRLGSADV